MRVTQEEPYKWGVLAIHLSQATILFFNYRRTLCPHDSPCSSDFFPPMQVFRQQKCTKQGQPWEGSEEPSSYVHVARMWEPELEGRDTQGWHP